jgi:hypothetical protein
MTPPPLSAQIHPSAERGGGVCGVPEIGPHAKFPDQFDFLSNFQCNLHVILVAKLALYVTMSIRPSVGRSVSWSVCNQ